VKSRRRPEQSTKGKSKMKRLSITFGTILLVLGCFAFSPAAKANQPIVGLWQVEYTGSCEPPVLPPDFFTYQQFRSDGLEFESGVPSSVRFVFTETLTVSNDRNNYDGIEDTTFYDAPVGGNAVAHCTFITHGTRISVNQVADRPNATASR
jgi:hypothetical protein